MDSDRRFSQEEIAAIFRKASKAQKKMEEETSGSDGLTLGELQVIAREAGIDPEFITQAVQSVDEISELPAQRRMLGIPVSAHRNVDLGGVLLDDDWDKLVVEIRQTFGARGKVTREGSLREWSNGNLHILLEPTETGNRLRMGTFKQSASAGLFTTLAILFASGIMGISAMGGSGLEWSTFLFMTLFVVAGLGGFGSTALYLSRWASRREGQMEAIGEKAKRMVSKAAHVSGSKSSRLAANTDHALSEGHAISVRKSEQKPSILEGGDEVGEDAPEPSSQVEKRGLRS